MMVTDTSDLSTYELDVYWTSGRPRDAALEAHLAACARCRAYLAGLDALDAAHPPRTSAATPTASKVQSGPTMAPWLQAIARARRGRWALSATGAVALTTCAVVFVSGRHAVTTQYVGIKGTPVVEVLVHRERDTRIWDGRSPVRPGDALALLVACEGLGHVVVASPGAKQWERLSDAMCSDQEGPLPFTLVVDRQPGEERVAVVLSREEMDDKTLGSAIARKQRTSDVWVVDLVFPKEVDQ